MKRAVEIAEAKANGDEVPASKKAKVVDTSEHLPVPPGQGFEKKVDLVCFWSNGCIYLEI